MKEENAFSSMNNLKAGAQLFNSVIDKATERGHRNATLVSGTGAAIVGVLGSFLGLLGAVGGAGLGAFIGNSLGSLNDGN